MTQLKSPRRARVVELVSLGTPASQVARVLGISRERVRQLWLSETGRAIPRLAPMQPMDRESRKVRRFWARVQVADNGCWLWTGTRYQAGYGSYQSDGRSSGYTHRHVYQELVGPIPVGLQIDHLCRVPACCNPAHLEPVTQRENTLRSPIALAAINARKTHCKYGHEFTPENTYRSSSAPRWRTCRTCHNEYSRARTARKRVAA